MRRVITMGVVAAVLTAAAVVVWIDVLQDQRAAAAAPARYVPPTVQIDEGVSLSRAEVTAEVGRLVNDRRGWRADMAGLRLRVVQPGIGGTTLMSSTGHIGMAHFDEQLVLVTEEAWTVLGPRFAAAGGTLEDQRTWIVLHELGHLLGYREHTECPGPGQPAPVMRGSDFELGACTFNVWPNP